MAKKIKIQPGHTIALKLTPDERELLLEKLRKLLKKIIYTIMTLLCLPLVYRVYFQWSIALVPFCSIIVV